MVRRQESVTGWLPDCFPDRIHSGDFFFLFSIQGYGKDKPLCQLHCRKHSTFPFILCSVYSEPMAQVEFLSYYSFRIHFVVSGIPDSFTNLQNLIHASACSATAGQNRGVLAASPPCHNSPLRLPLLLGDPLRELGLRLGLK